MKLNALPTTISLGPGSSISEVVSDDPQATANAAAMEKARQSERSFMNPPLDTEGTAAAAGLFRDDERLELAQIGGGVACDRRPAAAAPRAAREVPHRVAALAHLSVRDVGGIGPDEDVDEMVPALVHQRRHLAAAHVVETSADERKARRRKIGDRHAERHLAAEPRLHRVPIARRYVGGVVDEERPR